MKILLINKYLFPKGGDAITTLATGDLLKTKGHDVLYWGMDHSLNTEFSLKEYFVRYCDYDNDCGFIEKARVSSNILFSLEAKNKVEKLILKEKPDLVHLNNFAHQISPSILYAFRKYKIPTVMTMHDYKLVCPSYTMFVDGHVCEKCKKRAFYQCVVNKCVKNSLFKSCLSMFEMYLHHNILNVYDLVDVFVSPSLFLKEKLRGMGFKKDIEYLPNFVVPNRKAEPSASENKHFAYLGRLSAEKGLSALVEAIKGTDFILDIIGDGPLRESLSNKTRNESIFNVNILGYKSGKDLEKAMGHVMAVVISSEWYENNPRSVLDSFARGKPVVGARIGGIPELVRDNETGWTFEAGNVNDLRDKLLFCADNPDKARSMGIKARQFVEQNFNQDLHYQKLMEIYTMALNKNK